MRIKSSIWQPKYLKMKTKNFILWGLFLIALCIYLFVTAPPALPDRQQTHGVTLPIAQVFRILETENDVVRSIWTKEIVKGGVKVGLKFSEDWRQFGIDAGPLPALFLRETAKHLERSRLRLSLFLGSDFPISSSNAFEGVQMDRFKLLKSSSEPQFFWQQDTGLFVGMFPDTAISKACVDCHNDHEDSPKNDWRLLDIMGATTWIYPKQQISINECLKLLELLREAYKTAYANYLVKVATFKNPPVIGDKWPRDGYYLPNTEEFIKEAKRKASLGTLEQLLNLSPGAKKIPVQLQ